MTNLADIKFPFCPVRVTKGRKFKGLCYMTESWTKSNGGYSGSGVRPLAYYQSNKGVDAITLEPVFFNGEPEVWDVDKDDLRMAKGMYARAVLERCLKRCGKDIKWRTNYLAKVLGCSFEDANALAIDCEKYLNPNEDEGNRAERLEAELEIREDIARG